MEPRAKKGKAVEGNVELSRHLSWEGWGGETLIMTGII